MTDVSSVMNIVMTGAGPGLLVTAIMMKTIWKWKLAVNEQREEGNGFDNSERRSHCGVNGHDCIMDDYQPPMCHTYVEQENGSWELLSINP